MRRRRGTVWRYALTAVLGLPRGAAVRPAPRRRDPAASSYEVPAEAVNALQFTRAYWLPPFGRGNGLEALFWAPLADVPAERADAVLGSLAERGIPGWAGRPRTGGPDGVWVQAERLEEAGDVLMRVLGG